MPIFNSNTPVQVKIMKQPMKHFQVAVRAQATEDLSSQPGKWTREAKKTEAERIQRHPVKFGGQL